MALRKAEEFPDSLNVHSGTRDSYEPDSLTEQIDILRHVARIHAGHLHCMVTVGSELVEIHHHHQTYRRLEYEILTERLGSGNDSTVISRSMQKIAISL